MHSVNLILHRKQSEAFQNNFAKIIYILQENLQLVDIVKLFSLKFVLVITLLYVLLLVKVAE